MTNENQPFADKKKKEGEFYHIVGANIIKARALRDMTQEQLADKLGISRVSVSNIESGKQRLPIHLIYPIAKSLGIVISELFTGCGKEDHPKNDVIKVFISESFIDDNGSGYIGGQGDKVYEYYIQPQQEPEKEVEGEPDFMTWCKSERISFSAGMLHEFDWYELSSAQRVVVENFMVCFDQLYEKFKEQSSTNILAVNGRISELQAELKNPESQFSTFFLDAKIQEAKHILKLIQS